MLYVWYIYLHNWVIFGVNVSKYSSQGADPVTEQGHGRGRELVQEHVHDLGRARDPVPVNALVHELVLGHVHVHAQDLDPEQGLDQHLAQVRVHVFVLGVDLDQFRDRSLELVHVHGTAP